MYCHLVVPEYEKKIRNIHTNNLIRGFIEEQVQYFPSSQIVIYFWIITAAGLFRGVVVEDKLPIYDIPHV